jgi:hypothetical protein
MRCIALLWIIYSLFLSYAGSAQISRKVMLLCNWQDTTRAPRIGVSQRWNDVWGLVWKGKEYAVIGSTTGTHVIDIDACTERAYFPGHSQGTVHRDFKTYGHYLYGVADEGVSTLQVFDYSYLPDSLHLVWESDPRDFSRCHNIFIDTARGRLYCASVTPLGGAHDNMRAYGLANPEVPQPLMANNSFGNSHDIYARNDTAWCSNGYDGYRVFDMSKLPVVKLIGGLLSYPFQGFNHSSWMGYNYIGVMADETFGKPLKVIDTRNPGTIEILSTFGPKGGGTDPSCMPHNPYLLGRYALTAYYQDGLQIYDLSDPYHPVEAGYYDTYPDPSIQTFAGAWGCYPYLPSRRILVGDMQTGLYVLDADEAMNINKDATFSIYPNPADDQLYIQLPFGSNGHLSCVIYSITGAVMVKKEQEVSAEINPPLVLSLPPSCRPGMYVLRAIIGSQSYTARFIKR